MDATAELRGFSLQSDGSCNGTAQLAGLRLTVSGCQPFAIGGLTLPGLFYLVGEGNTHQLMPLPVFAGRAPPREGAHV